MTASADLFRKLHEGPELLVLANCWDAGSARVLESLGARAMATTSAGLAWANGYPDGDALPLDRLVPVIRAIRRVIAVPLTVDVEGGYSEDVGDTIRALAAEGVAGINIEDGTAPPEALAAKIARAKEVAPPLFVNARTDVYLRGLAPEADRVKETLARAKRYRDAGADGIFVPKVVDSDQIRAIAEGAGLPLNVLAWPKLPPAAELIRLGVRRLSAGSGLA